MMRRGGHMPPPHSSEGARPNKFPPAPVEGGGGISASWGANGLEIRDTKPTAFWAKITGRADGESRYSWVEIDEGDVDSFDATLAEDFAAEGTSEETGGPAYEVNGNEGVPTGTRVKMWPAGDLSYYLFEYSEDAYTDPTTGEPVRTPGPSGGRSGMPGWDSSTCLLMTIVDKGGLCDGIDDEQRITLTSLDGITWTSTTDFTHLQGSGPVTFAKANPPEASIDSINGYWIGPVVGGHLMEFGSDDLCATGTHGCQDSFVALFKCVPCAVSSGSYSPPSSSMAIPSGATRSSTIVVPPQSGAPTALRLCLNVPCAGGISNLTVTLTAPNGTVYTLLANPGGVTAQTADIVLSTANGVMPIQSAVASSGTLVGVYTPVQNFGAYSGPDVGLWVISIANAGPCSAEMTCATLCFGSVATGLTLSSVASPDSGTSPLSVTVTNTVTGTPYATSFDPGDGSPLQWVYGLGNFAHTYTGTGTFEGVIRVYSGCGFYVEDTVTVSLTVPVDGCPDGISSTLRVTFSGGTGTCAALDGQFVDVEWVSGVTWVGVEDFGGGNTTVTLEYDPTPDPGSFEISMTGEYTHAAVGTAITDCDPLTIDTANLGSFNTGCVDDVNFTITEV
jgi:hypothetical protein